ncbi:hypothetical protein BsWGS_24994 [Bradybaena similaris]
MDMQNHATVEKPGKARTRKPKVPHSKLTEEAYQERQLKLLKSRLLPLLMHPIYGPRLDMSDSTLLKWLRHCESNAFLADARIRACLEYRRKHGIDDLLLHYQVPDFANYYAGGVCGVDKQGSPIYYELLGTLNFKDIIQSATRQQLILFKIYQHECILNQLKRLSKYSGRSVDTILVIVDMQRCNEDTLWNPALRTWAQIIEVLQDLYPGLVKEIIIINVHFIYKELYISLRPYLSRSTLKLITVLGQGFMPHLLRRVEKHEIPAFLGGYKCDYNNNPKCMAQLNWSTEVPEFMKFTNKRIVAPVSERTILGGEKHTEEYHVSIANSILAWEFYEVSHPIVFSVYLDTIEDQTAVLKKTLVADNLHHMGYLLCRQPGRYLLLLDNCKDFANPARLVFLVEVKIPQNLLDTLAPKVPLGDTINFRLPIGEKERKMRQKTFHDYPHMLPKVAVKS